MPLDQRLRTLSNRHATLEACIAEENTRPRPNDATLVKLKRRKLQLKEKIEHLRTLLSTRAETTTPQAAAPIRP